MWDADATRWELLIAWVKADLDSVTPPPIAVVPRLTRKVPADEDWDLAIARARARAQTQPQPAPRRLSAGLARTHRG
jgi:hypothetical protein